MNSTKFDLAEIPDTAWCPGCGNMSLLTILKESLEELDLNPLKVVISSGIGQAAKMPQYLRTNYFNGLHGRALPVATAIKMVNPTLTVICEGGDGDMYGEGGNHFIHTIRRNPDILHLVHNNMVYGLTQGQASPTSQKGFITPIQVNGVINEPFNPLATAVALGATFVARTFTGNKEHAKSVIKAGIIHKGYALVDIFDPCISFNKTNTFKWYKENTVILEHNEDIANRSAAFKKSLESAPYPLGIIYQQHELPQTFEEQIVVYQNDKKPLYQRPYPIESINKILEDHN